jgi:hypothetical protein
MKQDRKIFLLVILVMFLAFTITFLFPKVISLTGKWIYFPVDFYLNLLAFLYPLFLFTLIREDYIFIKSFVLGYSGSKLIDFILQIKDYVCKQETIEVTYLSQLSFLFILALYLFIKIKKGKR